MRARTVLVGFTTALLLAGCGGGTPTAEPTTPQTQTTAEATQSPTTAATPPTPIEPKRTDIVYAQDGMEEHKLDLYMPAQDTDKGAGPYPTVVFVHGGGWAGGDKGDINNEEIQINQLRDTLLHNGYAIASVNYRLMPKGTFPEPMQDVAAAVRFLKKNAGEYWLDPNRFVMMGDSAGGHLATMAGVTSDDLALQGSIGVTDADTKVDAIVGYYGLYDLTKRTEDQQNGPCQRARPGAESSHGRLIGADPDSPEGEPIAAKASPVTYVSANTPPVLMFHGSQDCTTPPPQAERSRPPSRPPASPSS